jgi:hypothetical protein
MAFLLDNFYFINEAQKFCLYDVLNVSNNENRRISSDSLRQCSTTKCLRDTHICPLQDNLGYHAMEPLVAWRGLLCHSRLFTKTCCVILFYFHFFYYPLIIKKALHHISKRCSLLTSHITTLRFYNRRLLHPHWQTARPCCDFSWLGLCPS